MVGGIGEPLNGGFTDAPLGRVQHPQQADGVGRVHQQLQIGEHVLDLAPVVEAQATHNDVRDTPPHQRLLHRPGLGIGAIQHGHIPPTQIRVGRFEHAHAVHHRLGLGDFVVAAGEGDQLPFAPGGPQHLVDALGVVGDQGIGRLQDRGGGAVVLLQLHHGFGGQIGGPIAEVVLEAHQDREIGGPEAVDALVGIAHHKHRAALPIVKRIRILAVGD